MSECPKCECGEEPVATKDHMEFANFQRSLFDIDCFTFEEAAERYPLMCSECCWIGTAKEFGA